MADKKAKSLELYKRDEENLNEIIMIDKIKKIQKWWRMKKDYKKYSTFFLKLSYLKDFIDFESHFIKPDYYYEQIYYGRGIFVHERVQRASPLLMNLPEEFEIGKIPIEFLSSYLKDTLGNISSFSLSFLLYIINNRLKSGLAYLPCDELLTKLVYHRHTYKSSIHSDLSNLSTLTLLKLWGLVDYLCLSRILITDWIGVELFQRFPYYIGMPAYYGSGGYNNGLDNLIEKYPQFYKALEARNNVYYAGIRRKTRELSPSYFNI